jgi:hypothetical protein
VDFITDRNELTVWLTVALIQSLALNVDLIESVISDEHAVRAACIDLQDKVNELKQLHNFLVRAISEDEAG